MQNRVWRPSFVSKKGNCGSENPSKGLQHPRNTKIENSTWKDLLYMTKYLIQYSQMYFYLIVPKKGNCELKDVKYASSILGKRKLKILHERTCSVQLNSMFYCVKLVFIWLFPQQFVEYHPHLQFGACHIAPNLAGIARPQILSFHNMEQYSGDKMVIFVGCEGQYWVNLQYQPHFPL